MIDNRLVEDVQLKLRADHFFEPLHGRIYDAILKLTDSNRIANPVTLKPLFDGDESIKEVGGPAYLAKLTGSGAAVIGARDFAAQIYDLALLRALVGVGRDVGRDLGLQRCREHLPCTVADQLVQQRPRRCGRRLLRTFSSNYREHGRTFPTGVGAPALLEGIQGILGKVRPSSATTRDFRSTSSDHWPTAGLKSP